MGIGIDEVRLGFSGIRLVTDSRLTSYGKEILLAAAGPAINLISLGLCGAFFAQKEIALSEILVATDAFLETGEGDMLGASGFFALSSLMHAAVNLLPVSSFDGGRITSCLLARLFDVRVAERVVEITTLLSSVLLWTAALYLMLKVASGLGIFVFAACVSAICAERGRSDG
jgi:Zn-dependent protease